MTVSLIQAVDDPQLLGAAFRAWPGQRRLLELLGAGPRLHVWALGRRSGKTTMLALAGLHACLLRPELLDRLRPGERGYAVAIATNVRQARLIVAAARSIVERSPLLAPLVESATDDELAFVNGTSLAAFPCTSRGARGWPVFALFLDEAAHLLDSEGNAAAENVWRALSPSTLQFGGLARVVVSSTPWGSDGWFAELHARAASGELPGAVAVRASTLEMNPTIQLAELEAERARDPEGYLSEFAAEFAGGGRAFLDPDRVEDAVADRAELPPDACRDWVAGLDPAFSSDPFGLAIVGRDRWQPGRLLLGYCGSWKPRGGRRLGFEERREVEDSVLREVAEVCRRYRARVVTDQFLAPAVVDRLRGYGLSVRVVPMTAASKTAAFVEARARIYTGSLELYPHAGLLAELRRLRSRHTAGAAAVVNPRVGGSHGDIAQAFALAVYEHDRRGVAAGSSVGEALVAGPGFMEPAGDWRQVRRAARERSAAAVELDDDGPAGFGYGGEM